MQLEVKMWHHTGSKNAYTGLHHTQAVTPASGNHVRRTFFKEASVGPHANSLTRVDLPYPEIC